MTSVDLPPGASAGRVAGAYATAEVPTVSALDTVGAVRDVLHGGSYEAAHDAVVLDHGRPIGLLPLEVLLAGEPTAVVEDVMLPVPPSVAADTDQEVAAHAMVRAASRCLLVVDPDGSFRGLIPADRMLAVLLDEHDSDMARLGGYVAGASRARGAAQEPVRRRLWHRLPWLLLGVLGAMGSAVLVGAFDAQLEANVIVAFFVPSIVYMADAVGTQTETVLIRALAAGVTTRAIIRREIVTGLVMGPSSASCSSPSSRSAGVTSRSPPPSRWPWSRAARSRRSSRWSCPPSSSTSAETPRSGPVP
jgi:magnesium transporter